MARKKKNITLENVLIEDYAAEGKSLARVDGKVIFVEQVVPGDVVDVRLTKNKKTGERAGLPIFMLTRTKECSRSARILAPVAAASGRCCLTICSCSISKSRCRII
ncbi:TRAM domain-containing protein [Niabella sp. W65]|nr:TRAM domain-containing protein [Niabella sp. W65]MCH7369545.1 TRAM domain-containing protein [Niabella sp. W65]ULT45086.1 TRAM domain-containing protein [Niabella sp. I65]